MKTSKKAAQKHNRLSLDELQRELSTRGWTVRQSRDEEIAMVATKRNIIPPSNFLTESNLLSNRRKVGTRAIGDNKNQPKDTLSQAAATDSDLEHLHRELSKKRWSTMVGCHCDHNPRMPLFKSEVLRVSIPDSIDNLKREGWSVKIKQDEAKTTIMVLQQRPSLIKRLRNRFK